MEPTGWELVVGKDERNVDVLPSSGNTLNDNRGKVMRDSESQMFSLFCLTLLMTNRKKSRLNWLLGVSSCVRVTLCLPGPRLVFDQINC